MANPLAYLTCQRAKHLTGVMMKNKIPKAHLHFSHLFNAYSKYFNTRAGRHGALFERRFKRKEISDKDYFRKMVLYIHNNPVHHKFHRTRDGLPLVVVSNLHLSEAYKIATEHRNRLVRQ